MFTTPIGAWTTVGADVDRPFATFGAQMDPNAIKVFHSIFQHAGSVDDHSFYFFPYSELKAYESDELNAGRGAIYVTATYGGKDRPVYFLDFGQLQDRQAINVGDDRYVRFYADEVARKNLLSPNYPVNVVSPNYPTSWTGTDEATFEYSEYSVLDDNGNPVTSPITWDSPFPQNDSQFLSGIEHFFSKLKQIAPDIHMLVHVGSLENNANFPQVYANVDGILRADIVEFANGNIPPGNVYQNLQNVEWILSAGKVAVLRQPVDGTAAQIETGAVAYLLVKDGNSFFSEIQPGPQTEVDPSEYMPMFYALGSPTGSEQDQAPNANNPTNRLYWRSFEGGMVYLNWTGGTQTVSLPSGQTYFDQNGNPVTQLTLADQTGTYVTTQAGTRVAYPSIGPPSGTTAITGPITVTITDPTPGSQIYYTLDGSIPTTASTPYSGPFTLSQSATVTAIATVNGQLNSFEDVSTFNVTSSDPTANFVLSNDAGTPFFASTYAAITLDQGSVNPVTLNYTVTNLNPSGSGLTFSPTSGSITFAPGEIAKALPINVYLSSSENATEALQVTLTSGTNVTLGLNTTYTYTITANNTSVATKFANLHPVASGMLSSGNPNTACVSCQTVDTGTAKGGINERSLFQFDLSALPSNSTVQKAEVIGFVPYSLDSSGSGVLTTSVYRMLNSWTDGAATWNNSGGVAANYAAQPSDTENALSGCRWNVTADTQNFLNGAAANNGWLLIGPENAQAPEVFRLLTNHSPVAGVQVSLFATYTVPGTPQSVLSGSSLTFGSQNIGTTSGAQTITVTNSGNAPLSISGISITGTNASDFPQTNTCGSTVPVGTNCSILVSFSPSLGSAESATLNVADNVAGSPQTVALSGTGIGVPEASLAAASVGFGNQNLGTTSAAQSITLSNPGTGALSITNIAITGTNQNDFNETNTCASSLAAATKCQILITFSPQAVGPRSAMLTVTDNAAGSPHTTSLSGTGVGIPQAAFGAPSVAFGNQNLGTTSAGQSITLSNPGTGALSITNIAITGTNQNDFNQTNTCGSSVAASSNCTILITFTPQAVGPRSAMLTVTDNAAGSPHTASLSGTGVGIPQASLGAPSVAFGNQNIGTTSAAQSTTLSNPGTGALSITSIAIAGTNSGDFRQTNTCGSNLAATANCSILITFAPQAVGPRSATLTVTDNAAGSPHTAALNGTGVGVPEASLSAPSVAFGNQNLGTTSAGRSIVLSNPGTGALSITSIAITGTNYGDFTQTNNCGSSVAATATCTILITFSPQAAGSRSASLTITDNAAGSPHKVGLSGTGVPVPEVSLSASTLTFANQNVGSSSAAQVITLSNPGTAALSITSIALTGTNSSDFVLSKSCGTSLAVAGKCSISVTFRPRAQGLRSASVTITDNAAGSPQAVGLSGTGVGIPQASISPGSVSFGLQRVNTTTSAQTVTITDSGSGNLTFSNISISGTNAADFTESNTCGASMAPSGKCTISVKFTPRAAGSRSASLMIYDNQSGSPQKVALSGYGEP